MLFEPSAFMVYVAVVNSVYDASVGGLECISCRGVRPLYFEGYLEYDKQYPVVRLQFWNSESVASPFCCHYSQFNSDQSGSTFLRFC